MDEAYKIADTVEMIHPARFLYNAGSTPKEWNKKMLADPHFKILFYEGDSKKVFSNTEIKGGVVVSYRDKNANYGAIEVFTPYQELNTILKKILANADFDSFSKIVFSAYANHFTDALHTDFPTIKYHEVNGKNAGVMSKGHDYDLKSNYFEALSDVFVDEKPSNIADYYSFLGLIKGKREFRFIKKKYINPAANIGFYKVVLSAANGSGKFGEALTQPVIVGPDVGGTETFITVGNTTSREEADNIGKYIKTKMTRALLGILKSTQHLTPEKWKYVPLQDFTSSSDINWNTSIHNIDLQLYKKYGLTQEEIDFIETHVKEME